MTIQDTETGGEKEVIIEEVDNDDYKWVKKHKDQFQFNWNKYKGMEVHKLHLKADNNILGLICLVEHADPGTNAMEIELLEVGKRNVGKEKRFDKIAGCLIAFACRESFKLGHDGFVFLTPKTGLKEHYHKAYGLHYWPPVGDRLEGLMIADQNVAVSLIKKYLQIKNRIT